MKRRKTVRGKRFGGSRRKTIGQRGQLILERLEERQLLAANVLSSLTGTIVADSAGTDGPSSQVELNIAPGGSPVILGVMVTPTGDGNGLDPAAPRVLHEGTLMTPLSSAADVQPTRRDGVTVAQFMPGENYTIVVGSEDDTFGDYRIDVLLPGDNSGDGQVDDSEFVEASAAVVQSQFGGNHVSSQFFRQKGINVATNLYQEDFDANLDGVVDSADLSTIQQNVGAGPITLELIGDEGAPVIDAALTPDTGDLDDDGLTNRLDATISGTLADSFGIGRFAAAIDSSDAASFVDLLSDDFFGGQDFTVDPNFSLDLDQLELIAGTGAGSLVDSGPHTLLLTATDAVGNALATPFAVGFEFDTQAPAAPSQPTLSLGDVDTINDSTPTIFVSAEDGTLIRLFSSLVTGAIGERAAEGVVSITTITLPDGSHAITATATDSAGNESAASEALNVIIDSGAPDLIDFDVSPPSSQTDSDGNPLTPDTLVTVAGRTESGATVEVFQDDVSLGITTSDAGGVFTYANVTLPFGQTPFTVVVTDAANNTSTFNQFISRNSAPQVDSPLGSRTIDEDAPDIIVDLGTVFSDPDSAENDTLVFSVDNSNPGLIAASIDGQTLTLATQQDQSGSAVARVFATDSLGSFVEDTLTVDVTSVNDAPVAIAPETVTIGADRDQSIPGISITDVDADQDDTFFATLEAEDGLLSLTRIGTVTFTFGDGDENPRIIIKGSLADVNSSLATVSFLHAPGFLGSTSISFQPNDSGNTGAGGAKTDTKTINVEVVLNQPPVANDDSVDTTEDVSFSGNVLVDNGNGADTDPDGDDSALTVANAGTITSTLGATVVLNANGNFTYNPLGADDLQALADGESATDTFDYTLSDGISTAIGTVSVMVSGINDDPSAADDDVDTNEDTPVSGNVLNDNGNGPDIDVEDQNLTVTTVGTITTALGASVTIAANGDFTYDPSGSSVLQALTGGQTRADVFDYIISDGSATSSAVVTVTVTGVNDLPVAQDDDFATTRRAPFSGNVLADNGNGADADVDGILQVNNVGLLTTALGAEVSLGSNGDFTYDPNPSSTLQALGDGETAEDSFTYTVSDAAANATATVSITVAGSDNNMPTAVGDAFQVDQGSINNQFDVLANDTSAPDDGETLTVAAVGTASGGGSVSIVSGGTAVRYSPAEGFLGVDRFTYTISDGNGGTDENVVTVQVTTGMSPLQDHIHATLSVYVDGERVAHPPANIGVQTVDPSIVFTSDVHTHDADGRVHIHPVNGQPKLQPTTIGNFFDTWRNNAGLAGNNPDSIFNANQIYENVVDANHTIVMFVNGIPNTEFDDYIVENEDEIVISYETVTGAGTPTFVPVPDVSLLGGAPLHIPLDGFDFDSQSLTFSAVSDNPNLVTTSIPEGNRSLRMVVEDFGVMVFEAFDGQVRRVTDAILGLAETGKYDGTIFHRIIQTFVIQGGDPTGTGFGDPTIPDFDDQFDVDLQHTSRGVLSMAKTNIDDTNSSQFFITAGPTRGLDFNHSVFGHLIEGENVRSAMSQVEVAGSDRPVTDVVLKDAEVFVDDENAVLMLKAPEGATGTTNVTVTVEDGDGKTLSRTFEVVVTPDATNGGPFLEDIPSIRTTENTPVEFTLSAVDVEGDAVVFDATLSGSTTFNFTLDDDTGDDHTALITVTPPTNFTGALELAVLVRPESRSNTGQGFDPDSQIVTIFVDPASPLSASGDFAALGNSGQSVTQGIVTSLIDGDPLIDSLLGEAIDTWEDRLGFSTSLDVDVAVRDIAGDDLGNATILALDERGVPAAGRVTIDVDGNGRGWHVDHAVGPVDGAYDLYTVLLHEVGHVLGFTPQYPGFSGRIEASTGGTLVFQTADMTVAMDSSGQHLDALQYAGDLMSASLGVGERRLPTQTDASIIVASHESILPRDTVLAGVTPTGGEVNGLSTEPFGETHNRIRDVVSTRADSDTVQRKRPGRMAYRAAMIDQILASESVEADRSGAVSRFLSRLRETGPYSLVTLFRQTRTAVFERQGAVDRPQTRDNYLAITNAARDSHQTVDGVFSRWQ